MKIEAEYLDKSVGMVEVPYDRDTKSRNPRNDCDCV